jgi:hypothetical protein
MLGINVKKARGLGVEEHQENPSLMAGRTSAFMRCLQCIHRSLHAEVDDSVQEGVGGQRSTKTDDAVLAPTKICFFVFVSRFGAFALPQRPAVSSFNLAIAFALGRKYQSG